MSQTSACPDLATYQHLGAGLLPAAEEEAVLRHLEACDDCAHKLDAVPDQDTLARLVGPGQPLTEPAWAEKIAGLVERLCRLGPGMRAAASPPERTPPPNGRLAGVPSHPPADTTGDTLPAQPAGGHDFQELLSPAQAADELGRLGPYRVLAVLGAGGMGVVFQAEDPQLQRPVALKALRPGLAASADARQRFLREARAAAAVKHDHVVAIYQVGEDHGVPFLAMELLEGEPLEARLRRAGQLPVPEVLRIGREMAEGLAAAHGRGLIHRDIKPANVWLEGEPPPVADAPGSPSKTSAGEPGASATGGRVKILDFGLVRASDEPAQLTQQGAVLGTPQYMAPEQAQGRPVDGRTDLFSLGCVLYRLATGRLPFQGPDTISTLMAVAVEEPPAPHRLDPGLPPALSDLVMKLLAKDPDRRPATARAVAEALAALAQGQEGAPPDERHGARETRGGKKRRRAAVIGGAVLLAGLVGLWAAGVFTVRTKAGVLVVKVNEPHPDVYVDGEAMSVTWDKGGKTAVIRVRPGTRKVEIKKDGFTAFGDEVSLDDGGRRVITARLAKASAGAALPPRFKNRLGMEFALVGKGTAWLGGGGDKLGGRKVEIPYDFYLGVYEVTQEEWQAVTGLTPSFFSRQGEGGPAVKDIPDARLKRFPVECVSWDDAQAFLSRLNDQAKESGWLYRLPTEAEWEYACRGGPRADRFDSAFDYYFEKPMRRLSPDQANFENDKSLRRPRKVGSYPPNRLGLYDMHGNVWEWCADCDKAEDGTPRRPFRGGAWDCPAEECRAACRFTHPPSAQVHDIGLRVARVPVGRFAGLDEVWLRRVAALPPDEQAAAVAALLKERNLGFDGQVTHQAEDGAVTQLKFSADQVTDLTPVRALERLRRLDCTGTPARKGRLADLAPLKGLRLTELYCFFTNVSDLAPLKDMGLTVLDCGCTNVSDLAPLRGMKLEKLWIPCTRVADLAPLKGMGLKDLDCHDTLVRDLTPLKDMPLVALDCGNTAVPHLEPLKGIKLKELWCYGTPVTDLAPLRGMPLTDLNFDQAKVLDWSPLAGLRLEKFRCRRTSLTDLALVKDMPLREIFCDFDPRRDAETLRSITTLETINGKPAKELLHSER